MTFVMYTHNVELSMLLTELYEGFMPWCQPVVPCGMLCFSQKLLGAKEETLSCGRNVLGRTNKRLEGAMGRKVQTKDFQPECWAQPSAELSLPDADLLLSMKELVFELVVKLWQMTRFSFPGGPLRISMYPFSLLQLLAAEVWDNIIFVTEALCWIEEELELIQPIPVVDKGRVQDQVKKQGSSLMLHPVSHMPMPSSFSTITFLPPFLPPPTSTTTTLLFSMDVEDCTLQTNITSPSTTSPSLQQINEID